MGQEILLPEENFNPLDKDRYYHYQLIGCEVITTKGDRIGRVRDIESIAENDLLVIDLEGKEALVPFSQKICLEVNLNKKVIIIDPPEGLLELNEI